MLLLQTSLIRLAEWLTRITMGCAFDMLHHGGLRLPDEVRIAGGEDLVQDQDIGRLEKRGRESEPRLHAAAERLELGIGEVGKFGEIQDGVFKVPAVLRQTVGIGQPQLDVEPERQIGFEA